MAHQDEGREGDRNSEAGHFRSFETFIGQISGPMACSKTLFILRADNVSPLDARLYIDFRTCRIHYVISHNR